MSSLYVDTIRNRDGNGAPVFDRGIVISGIITASGSLGGDSVGIGSTTIIDSSFQLQNILSLDSTTLSTLESALEIEPNNFNSLRISGISTFLNDVFAETDLNVSGSTNSNNISGIALSVSDFLYSIGVSTALYLQGTHLNYSGVSTISYQEGINLYYSGISTLSNARGTSLHFTGISTADNLRSTTLYSSGVSTVTYLQGTHLNYSGVSTISTLYSPDTTIDRFFSGISTINNLNSGSITGVALTSTNGNISNLLCGIATITNFNSVSIGATSANISNVTGAAATITNISATSFDTSSATAGIITSTNIVSNTVESININTTDVSSSGIITSTSFHTGPEATSIRILSSRITGPSEIIIDPSPTGIAGTVRIAGDLYIDGDQFYVNSGVIQLADSTVGIATTVISDSLLNGSGISIGSSSIQKSFTWNNSSLSLRSSENIDVAIGKTYKINGVEVLSSTTLGSGVTQSNLTSVGILESLSVGSSISATSVNVSEINSGLSTITTIFGNSLDYSSLYAVSGIVTNQSGDNLNYIGVSTITHSRGETLRYTGISTVSNIRGNTLYYSGISTISNLFGSNLEYTGISTITNVYSGFTTTTTLYTNSLEVSGITTFLGDAETQNISVTGNVDATGTYKISGTDVLTSTSIGSGVTNSSLQNVGTLAGLNVSGLSTFSSNVRLLPGSFIVEDVGGEIQNGGSFPTGVSYNFITDTLSIDLPQVGSVIAGDPSGQIDVIEITNVPQESGTMVTLTLIVEGDNGGWDTGNVSVTINGSAPTNLFWRNGAQPVGTTTSNPAFDIIRMRILRDDADNYTVFADWDPYY